MTRSRSAVLTTPVLLVFSATAGLGAALLFILEPTVGKWVLPYLGGAPAVWNTCLMFFQATLLAGYAWVHIGTRWLGLRRHAVVHAAIVLASFLLLPPELPQGWVANAAETPVLSLVVMLTVSIGAPFFVVATTAPLVQTWLSRTRYPSAEDPYYLYAASNAGSLLGLLAYPFVIEPVVGLEVQRVAWTYAYALYVVVLVVCGYLSWRGRRPVAAPSTEPRSTRHAGWAEAAGWVLRAFVPSALLLTVTTHVTTDIAPVPLLWILPLALYLGTFIVSFARPSSRWIDRAALLQIPLFVLIGGLLLIGRYPIWTVPFHLLFLTVTAYVAHGSLARARPPTDRLTDYYLWISAGGALGGVFIVFVSPALLRVSTEYLLLIVLAGLARPRPTGAMPEVRPYVAAGILVAIATIAARVAGSPFAALIIACALVFPLTVIALTKLRAWPRAVLSVLASAVVAFAVLVPNDRNVIAEERNFFGTTSVVAGDGMIFMRHGRTLHGLAIDEPGRRTEATAYYNPAGPFGDVLAWIGDNVDSARVGIVGLGTGTAACHARPGQTWEYYEINPTVIRFASDTTYFRFLSECTPGAPMRVGDARLRIAEATPGHFDLLVLDAFNSDAVPVHLITVEAFELYRDRLAPDGVLLVNISNKWLNLEPVVARHAERLGARSQIRRDILVSTPERYSSIWMVLTHNAAVAEALRKSEWREVRPRPGFREWTDDFSNVLSVLSVLER